MSVLIVARYNGQFLHYDDNYKHLPAYRTKHPEYREPLTENLAPTIETDHAEETAEKLFEPVEEGVPVKERVKFEFVDSFFQPEFFIPEIPGKDYCYEARGFGWVAVVSDENYPKLKAMLEGDSGYLRRMYTIDEIPLNNDSEQGTMAVKAKAVYEHMSPTHWD